MSRTIKLLVATIAIALAATITGVIAYDQGRAARQDGTVRYELGLDRNSSVVTGSARGVAVRAQPRPYRLRLTPNTVIKLGPGPNCQPLTWESTGTGTNGR